jgi:hypothetical protein
MSGLDHSLLYQARKFITAANVHYVNTWILCYETSNPGSSRRNRYERLLREFVATRALNLVAQLQAKQLCRQAKDLREASTSIEEKIKKGRRR